MALLADELTCPPALFRTLYRDSHRSQAAAFGFDDALTRRRGAGCYRATGENARCGDGADCQRKDDPSHLSTSLPSGRFDRTWTRELFPPDGAPARSDAAGGHRGFLDARSEMAHASKPWQPAARLMASMARNMAQEDRPAVLKARKTALNLLGDASDRQAILSKCGSVSQRANTVLATRTYGTPSETLWDACIWTTTWSC
jgi:hypothetical protein